MVRLSSVAHVLLASVFAATANAMPFKGVNLGGWLVSEPWMTPQLFNSTGAVDEWHLCNILGKSQCLSTLQDHWSNFYTRDDFVDIKNAGLRYAVALCGPSVLSSPTPELTCDHEDAVRIPLGYWAVDLLDYEPYVSGQYPYLIQAVQWAGQLGLKVFIDIHGAPGSQNGWEETGLVGPVDFFANATNANRTLNVLHNLTTEFSDKKYGGVVTNIELLNEPLLDFVSLRYFYVQGADVVGAANSSGINTTLSDAFLQPHTWENFDPWNAAASQPAPHIVLDTHQFWGFPPLDKLSKTEILAEICQFSQTQLKAAPSMGIPPTIVGEWSLDSGITANSTVDASQDQAKRTWFRTLFEAQAAAYSPNGPGQSSIGWFYWSWQTQYDIDAWSYRKGLALGYIPSNVSDPSTYAFPILSNGCIDDTFNYTAPATTTSTVGGASATQSGSRATSTPSSSKGGASTLGPRSAPEYVSEYGLKIWLGIVAISLVSIAL